MPCNTASTDFLRQLDRVEPSRVREDIFHYPCRIKLIDGSEVDRAICLEDARGFTGDSWIHPDDVAEILPHDERLPARLASKLYSQGESGMGYEVFQVVATGKRRFTCVTHNVVDFPQLPAGLRSSEIEDVIPHEGRDQYGSPDFYDKPPKFKWCYFIKPGSEQCENGKASPATS
jgi:hypothetical protein